MLYSRKELMKIYGGGSYQINKMVNDNELFKIKPGIYADKELINPVAVVCKEYPSSIITMDSAFYYYNLTDVIPSITHIATEAHSYVIPDKNIKQYFINKDVLNIGKSQKYVNGENIFIYDKERLLIELIKRRNNIPFDYYKEIINNYRKIIDEIDIRKVLDYLEFFKNGGKILDVIKREVL